MPFHDNKILNATLMKETYFLSYIYKKPENIKLYNSLEKMVYEDVIPTATIFLPNLFALINSTILIVIISVEQLVANAISWQQNCLMKLYWLEGKNQIVLPYIHKSKTNIEQLYVTIHRQK